MKENEAINICIKFHDINVARDKSLCIFVLSRNDRLTVKDGKTWKPMKTRIKKQSLIDNKFTKFYNVQIKIWLVKISRSHKNSEKVIYYNLRRKVI